MSSNESDPGWGLLADRSLSISAKLCWRARPARTSLLARRNLDSTLGSPAVKMQRERVRSSRSEEPPLLWNSMKSESEYTALRPPLGEAGANSRLSRESVSSCEDLASTMRRKNPNSRRDFVHLPAKRLRAPARGHARRPSLALAGQDQSQRPILGESEPCSPRRLAPGGTTIVRRPPRSSHIRRSQGGPRY